MYNFVFGRRPVAEALRSRLAPYKVLAARGAGGLGEIFALAREAGVPVQYVPRGKLTELAGRGDHQGVLAYIPIRDYVDAEDILGIARARCEDPLVVVLDCVVDPQNLGAIVRSSECLGAHGIVIPQRHSAQLTPAVAKASAGALEHLAVARVVNIGRCLDEFRERGLWIVGSGPEGEVECYKADLAVPLALVVGGEGRGMRRLTSKKCDLIVKIPLLGRVASLSAPAAASILMYEIGRQRAIKGDK
ncbi:MAG: 23S rRNA (guanosine(2251)-2'-O)-methyltransferase RlmB [bacterium]